MQRRSVEAEAGRCGVLSSERRGVQLSPVAKRSSATAESFLMVERLRRSDESRDTPASYGFAGAVSELDFVLFAGTASVVPGGLINCVRKVIVPCFASVAASTGNATTWVAPGARSGIETLLPAPPSLMASVR